MLDINHFPALNSIFSQSVYQLECQFIKDKQRIQDWFKEEWQKTIPPVYGSVDLRNAGFKIAPIDMNLFPAGFNNLNQDYLSISIAAAKAILLRYRPDAKKILIVPESHTRNLHYWSNIKTLQNILTAAGFDARFGTLIADIKEATPIQLANGEPIILHPLKREEKRLSIDGFVPDLIVLNNDLADGVPEILKGLEQTIVPPVELGWSQRLKTQYFKYYTEVAKDFAQLLDFDPWLIDPLFRECGEVDFMQQAGLQCIQHHGRILFSEIEKKYAQYGIKEQPFLIVKANAGTYGMAVMTVRNLDELNSLNRKQRTKMATTKGGQPVTSVIIQEGVYTFERLGKEQAVAEPVVYLWGDRVVGGFYRIHKDKSTDENLNAPGMRFEPLAFKESCDAPDANRAPDVCQNRFYIYGVIAKLGQLSAAREIKDQIT